MNQRWGEIDNPIIAKFTFTDDSHASGQIQIAPA
jgi:hypothetical protein